MTLAPAKVETVRQRPEEPALRVREHRIGEVDALRGIAAVGVMVFHYAMEVTGGHAGAAMLLGRFGVQLFFIISGYVILMTVRRVGTAADFAVSRAARLYPAFWVACGLTYAAVSLWDPKWRVEPWEAWASLLMVQIRHMRPIDGVYWTLHQEMFFYMIMFGLLVLTGWGVRLRGRRPVDLAQSAVALVVLTSVCGLRFSAWFSLFLIGMVLYDSRGRWRWRHTMFIGLCAADIIVRSLRPPMVDHEEITGWAYPVVVVVCALMVFAATRVRMPWLTNRGLLFLGAVSYPLYLLHARIGYIVIRWIRGEGVGAVAAAGLAGAVMIALAAAVHYLVEAPGQRAVKGWWRRRRGEQVIR